MSGIVGVALGGSDALGIPLSTIGRTLWLVLGDRQLDLQDWDTNGFVVSEVDLGSPTVRDASSNLPGQDGSFDPTAYFGPRVVSLNMNVAAGTTGSRGACEDLLAPFLAPSARPILVYALDDDAELRQLGLRVTQWTAPVNRPNATDWQVQWVASDPIPLSTETMEVDIGSRSHGGRSYPRTYPRAYPPGTSASNIGNMAVGGTYPTYPRARIFGPFTDPTVRWLDPVTYQPTGLVVAFTGLTVVSGDYLDIDTKTHTVLLNSDPAADRFSFVDFPNTQFSPVAPGMAAFQFTASGVDDSTLCSVSWNNAWIR